MYGLNSEVFGRQATSEYSMGNSIFQSLLRNWVNEGGMPVTIHLRQMWNLRHH